MRFSKRLVTPCSSVITYELVVIRELGLGSDAENAGENKCWKYIVCTAKPLCGGDLLKQVSPYTLYSSDKSGLNVHTPTWEGHATV